MEKGGVFDPGERALTAEWLAKQERGELYVAVAELDGVRVGRRCLDFTSFGDEGIGYFLAASVLLEWRSRGIGSMIDRHLEQVARARGLHTLRAVVPKSNERAAGWHERLGDRCTGEGVVGWTDLDGREVEVDCWTFERQLSPPRIRPLCAEDVEKGGVFDPGERALTAEWLAKQERGELYVAVAELGGVPVGRRCLDFTYLDDEGIPVEGVGYGFAASVLREWHSRGIGSMIDRHLEQVARARGFHALRSAAAKSNEGAVRWHERQGDRCTGERVERWTDPDGREVEVDCWTFERSL
jgi:ribosomal protein S18 acetylase RimI-like enzyme